MRSPLAAKDLPWPPADHPLRLAPGVPASGSLARTGAAQSPCKPGGRKGMTLLSVTLYRLCDLFATRHANLYAKVTYVHIHTSSLPDRRWTGPVVSKRTCDQ